MPTGIGLLLSALTKWRNPYRADIKVLAELLDVNFKAMLSLNLSYELASFQHAMAEAHAVTGIPLLDAVISHIPFIGCTVGCSYQKQIGMLHVRTLDWELDGLGRNAVVFKFDNAAAGVYYSVGWPGLVGVLTANAPGRFSASINFPRSQKGLSLAWPPSQLLRYVFENCTSYNDAIRTLRDTEVCAPAFISVVGARPGDAAIVECTDNGNRVFHMRSKRPIAIANDHLSGQLREDLDSLSDGTIRPDTCGEETAFFAPNRRRSMFERMKRICPNSVTSALQIINARPLLNDGTKLQVAMSPTNGQMSLYGIEKRKRVSFCSVAPRKTRRS